MTCAVVYGMLPASAKSIASSIWEKRFPDGLVSRIVDGMETCVIGGNAPRGYVVIYTREMFNELASGDIGESGVPML